MNKVILVGRLTQDPEVRYTQAGKAVANFTLAVNRNKEEADFIPVVLWEKLAESAGNNLFKGNRVLIEGRLQVRSYEANDGQKRRITEIVAQNMEFLEAKKKDDESTPFGGVQCVPDDSFPA